MLTPLEIETLMLFNSKADELINSVLVKEKVTIKPGISFVWKQNEQTKELDFEYSKRHHSEDSLKSFILTLRFFIQDNEKISIRNMDSLYNTMKIHAK